MVEKWVELLAEQARLGQSKPAICANRSLKVATFYCWQHCLSKSRAEESPNNREANHS